MDYGTSMKSLIPRMAIPGAFVGLLAAPALVASARARRGGRHEKPAKAEWVCIAPQPVTDELHCARRADSSAS
jgi:hypothetical protein